MKSLRSLSQCIPKRETLNTNQNLRYHKEAANFHESVKEDHQANHIVKPENWRSKLSAPLSRKH